MKHGKHYNDSAKLIERAKLYEVAEAVDMTIQTAKAKFDETVEIHVRLGVDSRHADQQVRGAVVLPNGTGKNVRVLAICKGSNVDAALAAGADYAGSDEYVQKIQSEGWMEFDVVIATPDMMALVGRLGRVLGPRNLMPNPKTGTVTMDVAKAVEESKGGKITYRADRAGNVQAIIGKVSFEAEKLVENFKAFNETIQKAKPATAKGTYVTNLTITTTQGVGIKVDVNSL